MLLAQHTFGRHPTESRTVLSNPEASRMHAVVIWDGEHWLVQDMSTNGTFINGVRVVSSVKTGINAGDQINFGNSQHESWQVLDVSPPQNMLMSVTPGLSNIVLQDLVALPSEETPEVSVYMAREGHWVCESHSGVTVLQTGDLVGTHDCVWRFVEAAPCAKTKVMGKHHSELPYSIQSIFDVSQNEEHVSLRVKVNEQEIDLGQRNHHYLLLLLARKRIDDRAKGLDEREQGWIDKGMLGQMAGMNENHINIQVYRFRKQLISALPQYLELTQAVEKRRGEIRYHFDAIEINGGMTG